MRDILFRGKRISDNSWVHGGIMATFHPNYKSQSIIDFFNGKANCYCICANNMDIFVDQETIGMYTGLTDTNSNMIFEGDVVSVLMGHGKERHAMVGVIEYLHGAFAVAWRIKDYGRHFAGYLEDITVIGNIHDNPELIKEK